MSGIELAGKGEAVKQLRVARSKISTGKADAPRVLTDSEAFWQSYSAFIPTEGQIVVMFGNWYSDLLVTATHVSEPFDDARFDAYVENMRAFEQDNYVDVIKVSVGFSVLIFTHQRKGPRTYKLHGLDWRNT